MSNRTHRRRRTRRVNRDDIGRGVAVALAARGCSCEPEVAVRHDDGIAHLTVLHDPSCPAVAGGR